jgi:DNA-binding MarR family transcriptional regulator
MVKTPDDSVPMDTHLALPPMLMTVKQAAITELGERLAEAGHAAIREGHGCVFGFIEPEGSRLTSLAERSGLTKQAVGESVDDLQRLGYVERVPDPSDGRAKLVRLTEKGASAQQLGRGILDEIEQRWAAEVGEERVTAMRETLEDIYALVIDRAPAPA